LVVTSNPTGDQKPGAETDIYRTLFGTLDATGQLNGLGTDGFTCPTVPNFPTLYSHPYSQTINYSGGTGRFAHLGGRGSSSGSVNASSRASA